MGLGFLGLFVGIYTKQAFGEAILEKIGVSLIATSCISFLWMLHEYIENKEKLRRSKIVQYETIKNDFPRLIKEDKYLSKIDICGISLLRPLKCFIEKQDNYFDLIKSNGRNNVDVQLLFCSPKSEYLQQRAKIECVKSEEEEIEKVHKRYVSEAWWAIAYACQVYYRYEYISEYKGSLRVKMINDYILPITHFIIDSLSLAGYCTNTRTDEDSPRIKAYYRSWEFRVAKKEFKYLLERDGVDIIRSGDPKLNSKKLYELLRSDSEDPDKRLKDAIKEYIDNLVHKDDPRLDEPRLAHNIQHIIEANKPKS